MRFYHIEKGLEDAVKELNAVTGRNYIAKRYPESYTGDPLEGTFTIILDKEVYISELELVRACGIIRALTNLAKFLQVENKISTNT